MINSEKQAELLLDHYKDTFQILFEHWRVRNRLFGLILVTLTLMLFQLTSPNVLERLANSYIRSQIESSSSSISSQTSRGRSEAHTEQSVSQPDLESPHQQDETGPVDFRFLNSLLWFVLMVLLVPYQQRSILIERQYQYLDQLEAHLNTLLGGKYITREGEFYKQNRPKYLRHVGFLYHWFFPSLLFLVMLAKLIREMQSAWREWTLPALVFTVVDIAIFLLIAYYTIRYVQYLKAR